MTSERERLIAAGVIRPRDPEKASHHIPGFLFEVTGHVRGHLPRRGTYQIVTVDVERQRGRNSLGVEQWIEAREVKAAPTRKMVDFGHTTFAIGDVVTVLVPRDVESRAVAPLIYVRRR